MKKNGAELSLNVIIIAVLVIIVLVVLVIIFSGKIQGFTKSSTQTSEPYAANVCDVPGTGRYCSSQCTGENVYDTGMKGFKCNDPFTMGSDKCCCCK